MLVPLALLACTLSPPAPVVESVTPGWGWTGETTDVRIEGQRFFPSIEVDAAADGGGRVDGTFLAWLDTEPPTPLSGVEHVGYDGVRAQVPAGLPVGVYDVRLRTPAGGESVLEDGFEVTATRADQLDLEVETAAYTVGETARLVARVLDPSAAQVADAMLVEVRAESASGAAGVVFLEGGLTDQVPLADGNGVRGRLDADGSAALLVRSDVPDDVTFHLAAADEDAVVAPDGLLLSWSAGAAAEIVVTLPYEGFSATAGAPYSIGLELRDALGNVVEDEAVDALVYEACGNWRQSISVAGVAQVEPTSTVACADNAIYVFASRLSGASASFAVLPGEAAAYAVTPAAAEVAAGNSGLAVLVDAVDVWGNRVEGHDALLVWRDTLGGLDTSAGVGGARCPGFPAAGPALQLCDVGLWRAGLTALEVTDAEGRTGLSGALRVNAAVPTELRVVASTTEVAAGASFEVSVSALDPFGNETALDASAVRLRDDTGTLSCSSDGTTVFLCVVTHASEGVSIEAEALGLVGAIDAPIDVTNGVLAAVELAPRATSVRAGDDLAVDVSAWDAYGNAYVVKDAPDVSLRDTTGTLTPSSVTLGEDGSAVAVVVLTRSAEGTVLTAARSGVDLGVSPPVRVEAGEATSVRVDTPAWAEVGAARAIDVTAVDAYGNTDTGYSGAFSLVAVSGACASVADTLVSGAATVSLACDTRHVAEQLRYRDGTFDVASDPFDVLDFGCADGPVASLSVDGAEEAVACVGSAVALDAGASSPGDYALVAWHFDDGVAYAERLEADHVDVTYEDAGRLAPSVVVVDADACASEAVGTLWAAWDDGSAAGPISVSASSATASTGAGVTVDVRATDCAGTVASGADVRVRADLGTVSGAATGAGLGVTLDGAGRARVNWVFSSDHAATATLLVGTDDGAAFGQDSVTVSGDRVLPRVARVEPAGAWSSDVDEVTVTFTEPVLPSSLGFASVALTGPSGVESVDVALSDDGRTLTLTPDAPVDAAAGVHTVRLSTAVRDLAGNRLDGAYTGAPAAFEASFGALPSITAYPASCAADLARFVPDGDDGASDESDAVDVTFVASGSAARWAWWITDSAGTEVRHGNEDGSVTSITWDGRGDDGRVVASGSYGVYVAAVDAYAALSAPCIGAVDVAQHVEAP